MPAVYDSFVAHGHSEDQAWRLTFIIPLIMLLVTGITMLLLCPDTPVGNWSGRQTLVQDNLHAHGINESPIVPALEGIPEKPPASPDATRFFDRRDSSKEEEREHENSSVGRLEGNGSPNHLAEREASLSEDEKLQAAQGEVIVKPSGKEILAVFMSLQTWTMMLCYACSFGGELAINSVLSSYYLKNFPSLGQTKAANWAAMFGFLNFVTRPLGGVVADLLYNLSGRGATTTSLWLKKGWMHTCGILAGILLVILGKTDSHDLATFNGLMALMAIFLEAGNGANFALVPHVHPHANGVVSGFAGAFGNLGGVIFAIIFRFMDHGTNYAMAFWVIGCMHVGINVLTAWVRPIPKGQIGGR